MPAILCEAQRRFDLSRRTDSGSDMIRRDQPKPVLKPSPALSMGPDRAAFNRAWSDEHRAARKKDKETGADPLPETSAYTPPLQQVRVTYAFREIETRETFIESRREAGRAKRTRGTQSR